MIVNCDNCESYDLDFAQTWCVGAVGFARELCLTNSPLPSASFCLPIDRETERAGRSIFSFSLDSCYRAVCCPSVLSLILVLSAGFTAARKMAVSTLSIISVLGTLLAVASAQGNGTANATYPAIAGTPMRPSVIKRAQTDFTQVGHQPGMACFLCVPFQAPTAH